MAGPLVLRRLGAASRGPRGAVRTRGHWVDAAGTPALPHSSAAALLTTSAGHLRSRRTSGRSCRTRGLSYQTPRTFGRPAAAANPRRDRSDPARGTLRSAAQATTRTRPSDLFAIIPPRAAHGSSRPRFPRSGRAARWQSGKATRRGDYSTWLRDESSRARPTCDGALTRTARICRHGSRPVAAASSTVTRYRSFTPAVNAASTR